MIDACLVAAAGALCYLNSCFCGFVFDDFFAVVKNADVTDPAAPLRSLWVHDFWGQDVRGDGSHKSYRPVTVLSFRLNHAWGGGLRPVPFHATNVLLHAVNCALVHAVARHVDSLRGGAQQRSFPLLAGLLFALHPVHTEAVTGIVGRAELLSAAFSLICLLLYAEGVRLPVNGPFNNANLFVPAALACATAAMLSKENGFTIVGTLVGYEVLHLSLPSFRRAYTRLCTRVAATLAVAISYLCVRRLVIGGDTLVKIFRKVENPLPFYQGNTERVLSTLHLHVYYVRLLIAPLFLSADWSFSCVPPVLGLTDVRNAQSALLYVLIALAVIAARPWVLQREAELARHRVRAFVLLALGMAPFVPAANIFFYIGTFIGERLLYMPSLGFCLLLAEPLSAACGSIHSRTKRVARMLVTALLTAYAARTWVRNRDWVSEESLFLAALRVCPDSAKVRLNNGILQRRHARWDEAVAHFERAQKIEPGYCEPGYWLGLTRVNQGRVNEGTSLLVKALACKWVALEAATALHAVVTHRLAADALDPEALYAHAELLLVLERQEDACSALTLAARSFANRGQPNEAVTKQRRAICDPQSHEKAGGVDCSAASADVHFGLSQQSDVRALGAALIMTAGDICRGRSNAYLRAVHALQAADPYDAALQREWARILFIAGRHVEAANHVSASIMLFLKQGMNDEAALTAQLLPNKGSPPLEEKNTPIETAAQ